MHILFVNKFYSPVIGGVETVVRQYAEYFAGKKYQVTVLAVSDGFSLFTRQKKVKNINVIYCASFGTFFSMPLSISFFFKYWKIYSAINLLPSGVRWQSS